MPAINFQAQFVPLIQNGTKCTTIRKLRHRPIKPGDKLYLYTGLRTPNAKLIKIVRCLAVDYITIAEKDIFFQERVRDMDALAQMDGFANFEELRDWFKAQYGLPFTGVRIRWEVSDA